MTASATCPFCTTLVPYDPPVRRIVCSRCGESFVPIDVATSNTQATEPPPAPPEPPSWKAYAVPGAVGLLMFVAVFYFGLTAILKPNANREKDAAPTESRPTEPKRASLWPPPALSGMKFLPPKTELALALQPAAFADYAAREGKDPVDLLVKYGVPKALWEAVAAMGLRIEDVSQVVAGLILPDDGLFPRGVVALILRKSPADEAAFLKMLKAEPIPGTKQRFRVTVRNLPLAMKREDDTTFLFAFEADDLNLGIAPPGIGHLSPSLQASLGKLSPSSFFWTAADEREWLKKPSIALIAKSELAARLPKLPDLRALTLGLSLEPHPTLTIHEKRGDDWKTSSKPLD